MKFVFRGSSFLRLVTHGVFTLAVSGTGTGTGENGLFDIMQNVSLRDYGISPKNFGCFNELNRCTKIVFMKMGEQGKEIKL